MAFSQSIQTGIRHTPVLALTAIISIAVTLSLYNLAFTRPTSDGSSRPQVKVQATSISNFEAETGSITSLTLTDLTAEYSYLMDLSSIHGEFFAFRWKQGEFEYSVGPVPTTGTTFQPVQPAGDLLPSETQLTSDLIEFSPRSGYTLAIRPLGAIEALRIDFIAPSSDKAPATNTQTLLATSGNYNLNSGAKYTSLPIISRDQWGANTALWDPYDPSDIDDPIRHTWAPAYHPVSRIVVHHTATANNPSDPSATVRSIYLYHAYTREWGDIGYNYLIDHLGNIYEGKEGGDEVYGYHASTEANAMSVGISLIGTFTSVNPTAAAQSALVQLMAEKSVLYNFDLVIGDGTLTQWLDTTYTVFGHRDSWFWCHPDHPLYSNIYICNYRTGWARNSTTCPGNAFSSLLVSPITPTARIYADSHFQNLRSVVSNVELQRVSPHMADKIFVGYNLPKTVSEETVRSYIPAFSGISSVTVEENRAYITVLDWNSGGEVVPPAGWSGYFAEGTFFPTAAGTDDRMETLVKLFRMDPNVAYADFILKRNLMTDSP